MSKRKLRGKRRHTAAFDAFTGGLDLAGNRVYSDDTSWEQIVSAWPCEFLTVGGGERVRGVEVTDRTTHVLHGDPSAVQVVTPEDRCRMMGKVFEVVSAFDPDGDGQEWRIELRWES